MRSRVAITIVSVVACGAAFVFGAREAWAQQGVYQCPAASPQAIPGRAGRVLDPNVGRDVLRTFYDLFPRQSALIPTEPISCEFTGNGNRYVVVVNPRITVADDWVYGISASRGGWADPQSSGDLAVYVRSVDPTGKPLHFHPLDYGRHAVRTMGDGEYTIGEDSSGVSAEHRGGDGRVGIDFRDLSLSTAGGDLAYGIYAVKKGSYVYEDGASRRARGAVIVNVIESERDRAARVRPIIGTRGEFSDAIRAEFYHPAAHGHIAITVEGYTIATGGVVAPGPQISLTGAENAEVRPALTGFQSRGVYAHHEGLGDIRVAVTDSHILTWGSGAFGIFADHVGRTITAAGRDGLAGTTVVTTGGGAIDIDLKDGEIRTAGDGSAGVYGLHRGAGGVAIDATGVTIATEGDEAHGVQAWIKQATTGEDGSGDPIAGTGEGDLSISVTGGSISTEAGGEDSAYAVWGRHDHRGDVSVTVAGDAATAGDRAHAVVADHRGTAGDVALTIGRGAIATKGDDARGAYATSAGGGAVTVSVTGGSVTTEGIESQGVLAQNRGAGDVTFRMTGGSIAARGGGSHAVEIWSRAGDVTVAIDGGAVAAHGPFGAGVLARSLSTGGGKGKVTVSVGPAGRVSGASGIGIWSDGPTDLNVSVAGRVEGDIFHAGAGELVLELPASGVITGTVHDPKGPTILHGSIGRLFYSDGATVTVAPGGKLTGVEIEFEGEKQVQAFRSTAGEVTLAVQGSATGNIVSDGDSRLAVTVTGTVDGDLIQTGDGVLTLSIPERGVITGTVYDPVSPLTVGGSIGRLFYSAGGTATIARTGSLTGVETAVDGETRVQALRSASGDMTVTAHGPVTGDIVASGDMTVTAHGPVTGDIVASGNLIATVHGAMTGDIVGEGKGRLAATVTGSIDGAIRALGSGDHTIVLESGGKVTARRASAAMATADGAGAAGVGKDAAGAGAAILHTDGNLAATLRGAVVGHIVSESGRLAATVAGSVDGDIRALGSGDHALTLASGSTVTGTVRRATTGAIAAGGTVGRLWFDRGGMATIGEKGRILGIDGNAVRSEQGELVVEVRQGAGESRLDALNRAFVARNLTIVEQGGAPVIQTRAPGEDARILGAPGSISSIPDGAWDLGVVLSSAGTVRVLREFAPRARVYEALPSMLLGLNAPSGFHERMAAPRSPNGMWARAEASGGSRETKRSRSAPGGPISWRHSGLAVETGVDIPLGDGALMGVSAHHRRIAADLSGSSGEIEIAGNGIGASLAADLADSVADGAWADARLSATIYGARLNSDARGLLQRDVDGVGYTASLEAGRRMTLGNGAFGESSVTPRAGVLYSQVDVYDFADSVGSRVSLEEGVSQTGRAGVRAETRDFPTAGSVLFGSVDVEHEFAPETRVRVLGPNSDEILESESDATRVRAALGGSIEWRMFTLRAAARYATGAEDYGGDVSLKMRF